jgi:tRNA threonylcarbamoyladenosine modification (KEOPS) complex Cgi121 subunit
MCAVPLYSSFPAFRMKNSQQPKQPDIIIRNVSLPANVDAAIREVAAESNVSEDKLIEIALRVALRKPNPAKPQ